MSTDNPQFASARISDIVEVTNGKGKQGVEVSVEVGGSSEEAVQHMVNTLGESARELGIEFSVEDTSTNNKRTNSKSFVSNWGSGSAWKHAGQN